MNKKELFESLGIKPASIKKQGSATIITTSNHKYVVKKNNRKADSFEYLQTRNFNNFPKIYSHLSDEILLMDYIEDSKIPREQKLQDLVYLDSILHNKTTFYKDVDDDYIKGIYEDILEKQNTIYQYYNELQNVIELEVYMSPSNYLLIRNISLIYMALNQSKKYIEEWYHLISEKHKVRYAYIHGNLEEQHLIENDNLYFISWDHSRIDLPIYDLETFYRKSFTNINLKEILEIYESKYPLNKEEYLLLIALLLIPKKIEITSKEYDKVKKVTELILYTDKLLSFLENNSNKSNHHAYHQ